MIDEPGQWMNGRWKFKKPTRPQCPYCGALAPYHEEVHEMWKHKHLDKRLHRWWWRARKLVRRGP